MRPNDGRAMPAFINQALNNEDMTVFGDGSQTRSFCYVSDLVEGIYRLLMSDINTPVNIGNPSEMTIMQLADLIVKVTGSTGKMVYKDLPVDDPKIRQPDISKAKELLNWEPTIDLEHGLSKTIEYFKNLNS
jgi:dTDP-glucose 4,6-dehydratase